MTSIIRNDGDYNVMLLDGKLYVETFKSGMMYHATGSTSFTTDQWYTLVVIWDGSSFDLYVNGELEDSQNSTNNINVPPSPFG